MRERNTMTLQITTGAMILAIFTILLLLNRQTGGFFEEIFVYLMPIPMVAYTSKYSFKSGLMVFAGMCFFSFIFGTLTSMFYAVTSAFTGLVLGTCIYKKVALAKTMLLVMGLAAFFNVLDTVALASVFGYDIDATVTEMQAMLNQVMTTYTSTAGEQGRQVMEQVMSIYSDQFLRQMFVISMVFFGLIQGVVVYYLSLAVLRRMRFKVPKAEPLTTYYPPRFFALIAVAAYGYGAANLRNDAMPELQHNISQTLWVCGYLFLAAFGVLALTLVIRKYLGVKNGLLTGVLCFAAMFTFPQILIMLGAVYVFSPDFHTALMQPRQEAPKRPRGML